MHVLLRRVNHIPYLILGMLPFLFITAVTFLEFPPVWPDEAIFADSALHISTRGTLATDLFSDIIPGMQNRALWYPPLYFYVLSWWTRLTAFDIIPMRLLSILCACLSLIVMYAFSLRITRQKWVSVLAMMLLGVDYSFVRAGQVARMDILTFLWIITAIYTGYEARMQGSLRLMLISGIASALAVVTHPMGCIAPATLVIYLFITKQSYRQLLREYSVLLLPVLLASIGWALWIGSSVADFITQYQLQFARKAASAFFGVTLAQYFWPWRLLFLLYAAIIVYACTLRKRFSLLVLLIIGTVVSIVILMWGKELWYTLYLQPWIILFLLFIFHEHSVQKAVYGIIFYIALNLWLILTFVSGYPTYTQIQSALAHKVPKQGTVYLSQIPDPYFIVRKQSPAITLLEFPTVPVSDELYERLLNRSDYIIINQVFDERMSPYIKRNMLKETPLIAPDGTMVSTLVTLKPRSKRK